MIDKYCVLLFGRPGNHPSESTFFLRPGKWDQSCNFCTANAAFLLHVAFEVHSRKSGDREWAHRRTGTQVHKPFFVWFPRPKIVKCIESDRWRFALTESLEVLEYARPFAQESSMKYTWWSESKLFDSAQRGERLGRWMKGRGTRWGVKINDMPQTRGRRASKPWHASAAWHWPTLRCQPDSMSLQHVDCQLDDISELHGGLTRTGFVFRESRLLADGLNKVRIDVWLV